MLGEGWGQILGKRKILRGEEAGQSRRKTKRDKRAKFSINHTEYIELIKKGVFLRCGGKKKEETKDECGRQSMLMMYESGVNLALIHNNHTQKPSWLVVCEEEMGKIDCKVPLIRQTWQL